MGPSQRDPLHLCKHLVCVECCNRTLSSATPPFRCPECRRDITGFFAAEFGLSEAAWRVCDERMRDQRQADIEESERVLEAFDEAFAEWDRRWAILRQRPGVTLDERADSARFFYTWETGYRGPNV